MNTDELLRVIEKGLKDIRTEITKRRDPNAAVRRARPVEERLDDLEHFVWTIKSDMGLVKSTMAVLEMNVARLQSVTTPTSTKRSPAKARPRARARRAGS